MVLFHEVSSVSSVKPFSANICQFALALCLKHAHQLDNDQVELKIT